ncbi:MAG: DNA polymerase [Tissierellia bacterium]|nr:DNA polymerase [Tissierellia bacterium]
MKKQENKILAIDIETYSSEGITNGIHKYVEAEDFEILLFAYKYNDEETKIIDLTKENLPEKLIYDLVDKKVLKTAFNAQFERICINKYFGITSKNWECTMIKSWACGLTGGLDTVSKALNAPEDKEKDSNGKRLIRKFSIPRTPTSNNPRKRNLPEDYPDEWEMFKKYCIQDVEVEHYIRKQLEHYKFMDSDFEKSQYILDCVINRRGIKIDKEMVEHIIDINDKMVDHYTAKFNTITGIETPNQVQELKKWLNDRTTIPITEITKQNKEDLFKIFEGDQLAKIALDCRYKTAKTSVAKYKKMLETMNKDHRSRGNLQFYGAKTGRWAGRNIQLQNLPQNHLENLDQVRKNFKNNEFNTLKDMYEDIQDIMSQLIRTAIIPEKGNKFVVADFSAIEARIIAWLADEDWVIDVFKKDGKIYEATAAKMFNLEVDEIKKGSPERQKGKVATLALGYQGGVGALKAMGALKMGIPESDLNDIVRLWRNANKNIQKLWHEVQNACIEAVEEMSTKNQKIHDIKNKVKIYTQYGDLTIELPSTRKLIYKNPRVVTNQFNSKALVYQEYSGVKNQWYDIETFGGKIVENIVQAIGRDCLAYKMLELTEKGYVIVFHVHDEVIIELPKNRNALNSILNILAEEIPWAQGLPLNADGYECEYYKKD